MKFDVTDSVPKKMCVACLNRPTHQDSMVDSQTDGRMEVHTNGNTDGQNTGNRSKQVNLLTQPTYNVTVNELPAMWLQ